MAVLTHDATKHGITLDALLLKASFAETEGIAALVTEYQPTLAELKVKPQLHKVTMFERAKKSLRLVIIPFRI